MTFGWNDSGNLERIAHHLERIADALNVLTHHTTGWVIAQQGYWHPPEEKKDDRSS